MSQKVSPGAMRWMIWVIAILLILIIGLAWGFYAESYDFFQETISMLGGFNTENGISNFPSFMIFTIGFLLVSVLCLITGIIYLVHYEDFDYAVLKGILLLIIAIGTFGAAIMHDLMKIIHGIGAFMFVTGFGIINFVWQLMRFARKKALPPKTRKWDYYLDLVMVFVLILSILVYFTFTGIYYFILDISFTYVATSQKVLLIAILIAIVLLDKDDM
jgi:hypothetical protein